MEIPKSGYEIKSVKRIPGTKPIIVIELIEDEKFELNVALEDFTSHLNAGFKACFNQELHREENTLIDEEGEKCFEIKSISPNLIGITACQEETRETKLRDFLEAYARSLEKEISKEEAI